MSYEDLTKERQDRLKSLWSQGEQQGIMGFASREYYEFNELNKHCLDGHKCTEDCKIALTKMERTAKRMFSGEELVDTC